MRVCRLHLEDMHDGSSLIVTICTHEIRFVCKTSNLVVQSHKGFKHVVTNCLYCKRNHVLYNRAEMPCWVNFQTLGNM